MEVVGAIVILAVIAGAAVVGFFRANAKRQAQANLRTATAQKLNAQAQGMLAGTAPGGDARAFQQILAARALTHPRRRCALQRGGPTGQHPEDHHRPHRRGGQVAFSPDGHRLASAGDDGRCGCGTPTPANPRRAAHRPHRRGVGCGVQPRRARLASASNDGTVRLWDADTGQPIGDPLTGHTGAVNGVAFSPDGHRLASAGDDGTVRLWDADTGQPARRPAHRPHRRGDGVAFSPDGHRLASAGDDGTVRLWDADTGQPIGEPLTGHTDAVTGWRSAPTGTAGHRRRRRDGAAVGRRHRPTHRRAAHRPHRRGERCGVQPRRAPAGQRRRRRHGAAVGRRHRPTLGAPAHRPHRRGVRCGVQPRRAPAGQRRATTTRCGCGTPTPANPSARRSPATPTR